MLNNERLLNGHGLTILVITYFLQYNMITKLAAKD